ncbi:hypothetical protein HYU13_02905, partial [Candidatus Woesearchaeota archaeon]|nr:hypothetical protein [Candidatus Woesearchaeota archaeon]
MKLFFVIFISVVSLLSIAVPAPLTIAATSFPNCSTNWSAYILGNNSNRGFDDYNNTITNGTAASFVQNGTLAANGGWTMPNSGAARKYLYNNDSVTIAYPHLISPFSQDGLSILWWNFSGNASDIKVCIDFYDDGNSQQYYKASFLLLDGANTATQSINLITNDCTTGFYCEQAGSLAARETDI